jgi:hypothetical protein
VIGILAEKGASFTPTSLSYTLTGASTVHHVLLQKSNGDYYLVLWNEINSYNLSTSGGSDVINGTTPVTLGFSSAMTTTVYSPNDTSGQAPTGAYTSSQSPTSVSLQVPDKVLIVQIRPAWVTGNKAPYCLLNRYTGNYINTQSSFTCSPWLWPGALSQEWYLYPDGYGHYNIQNRNTGNYINTQTGFACSPYLWAGASSQEWNLNATGDGYYYLVNVWQGTGINTQSGFACSTIWAGELSAEWSVIPICR